MENSSYKEIQAAKDLLKSNGYYVGNLWKIDDVKAKFDCTDEEAQYCLDKSLNNDATMEQIWLSIDIFGEMENLTKTFD